MSSPVVSSTDGAENYSAMVYSKERATVNPGVWSEAAMQPEEQAAAQRRLKILREKAATLGASAPPEILIEIEDIQRRLAASSDESDHGQATSTHYSKETSSTTVRVNMGKRSFFFLRLLIVILLITAGAWLSANSDLVHGIFSLEKSPPDISISAIDFALPNKISIRGLQKEIPTSKNIWVYVLSGDKQYHLRMANKQSSAWATPGRIDIGNDDKFGGVYQLGILIADPSCIAQEQDTLKVLPTCADVLHQIEFIRSPPS